jgi:hypothetical protein
MTTYKGWIKQLNDEKERIHSIKRSRTINEPDRSFDDFLHGIRERLAEHVYNGSVAA